MFGGDCSGASATLATVRAGRKDEGVVNEADIRNRTTDQVAAAFNPEQAEPVAPGGRTIAYQPALDGVRAIAVIAVLLFHAEVPGFDGGYLGVSVFFTLSGYLITSLLAAEMDRDGFVSLGTFYARRARRLVPASLLVVVLVVAARLITDWFDAVDSLRAQAIGSLLQVANWVFLAGGGSYQELLEQSVGTASPLEHYWSLAIEEQFYWIWPVAFVGLRRVGKTPRGHIVAVVVVTTAAVVAAPVIAAIWGADAAYWSTPARIAEILLGAVAALVLRRHSVGRGWALLAPLALAALAVCIVTFPTVGGPAYVGALPAVAVLSVALIVGLQAPSLIRTGVSVAPLVWIGTISYGVYLFHWPIFVVVDEDRLGIDGPLLLIVRLGLTLVIAQASFSLFERPIRHGLRITPRASLIAAAVATGVCVVIAALVIPGPRGAYWKADAEDVAAAAIVVDDDPLAVEILAPNEEPSSTETSTLSPVISDGSTEEAGSLASIDSDPGTLTVPPTTSDPPLPSPSRPIRVLVVGDSVAEAVGAGVVGWAAENPSLAQAEVMAAPGCGFVRGGENFLGGSWNVYESGCAEYFFEAVPERAAEASADVVVLLGSEWDLLDRRWENGDQLAPVDFTDRIDADYRSLTDTLLEVGVAEVVWLGMPVPNQNWEANDLDADRARFGLLRAAMDRLVESVPERVSVVDLESWLAGEGLDTDQEVRPDGIHFTPEAAIEIVDTWLGEQILRAALLN